MSYKTSIPASVSLVGLLSLTIHAYAQTPAPAADEVEDILVTGVRNSLEKAQEIKRNSDNVVDSIVAEDIGKFPDNTVAAALQRVPGIQVVNNWNNEIASPLIRGIGDIATTLDGREIFTGVGRGFAFQDLPAEALSGADVYKSNSADLVEGGIAGVINLKRVKPFGFKEEGWTVAANLRGMKGEQVDKVGLTGGVLASNRFTTEHGEMGFLVDVSYSDQNFNRPISFNCDPRSGNHGPSGGAGVVLPTCVGGLTDTGDYQRPQANAVFQWRPNDSLELYADALYAGYRAKFATYFIFSDIFGAQNITNPTTTGDEFEAPVNQDNGFYDRGSNVTEKLKLGQSATFNNVPGLTSTQAKTGETDQYVYGGGFKYTQDALTLNGDLSYVESQNGNRNIIVDISKVISQVDIKINDHSHGTTDMPGDPLSTPNDFRLANGLFQDINHSQSTAWAFRTDGTFDLDDAGFLDQIQFGGRVATRDAEFLSVAPGGPAAPNDPSQPNGPLKLRVDAAGLPAGFLVQSPNTIPVINAGQHWYTPDPDFLRNNTDTLRTLYGSKVGDPDWDPSRNYDASEDTYALYLQGKYGVDFANGVMIDGLLGGRITRTERSLTGTGRVDGVLTPVTRDTADTEFLPNASMRVKLNDELQLRFTYAKTIAQPFFGDLNPGLTYDKPLNANIRPNGGGGNPDLKPQKSDAVDAAVEYYFNDSSYVSAAVYHRTIKDRVAGGNEIEVIDGDEYNISRPRNLAGSTLEGVELSSQVFFDFLPEGFNGLGMMANYTFADSTIDTKNDPLEGTPLLGVSKNSYNFGLLYEKYDITARAVYNWRSGFNDGYFGGGLLTPGDGAKFNKVKANGRLDFSISYNLTPDISVSLDGVNVNGGKYYSYFDSPSFPHDIRIDDTFYGMGLRAKF